MSSDIAKPLFWIILLAAFSVWSITSNDVILGLDLQGGVTLRYELEEPDLGTGSVEVDAIASTIATLRKRIDAYGIRESSITRQGTNEIVIELPGSGAEEAGSVKTLVSRVGRLEWRIAAYDDLANGLSVADETARLDELLAQHVGKGAGEIDITSLDRAFPGVRYRWLPYSNQVLAERRGLETLVDNENAFVDAPLTANDFLLVRLEQGSGHLFTGADIGNVRQSSDDRGSPAVGITMHLSRQSEFGDWTEENVGRYLGIVLDGRMAQPPATINSRLDGSFVIQSGSATGFTPDEIRNYLTIIRSGSLQMKPRLLFENTIGPSLGESSIEAGTQSALWGVIVVLLFTVFYYRVNGLIAVACLSINLLMLAGFLLALQATLTLPGLAGLVLTIGMAIDANILVFERLREETDRAKGLAQSVKLGFEKATSTIIDANVTTFLTAFILYKLGTGPVKGFAVVLMLGILTSVFSVLVFGKTAYLFLIAKEWLPSVTMARLVKQETAIAFMSKARVATKISIVAVVVSLVAFVGLGHDAYGLDFLGGYKAQVQLNRPIAQGEVREAIKQTFAGAQVISVVDEDAPAGTSSQYVIKIKGEETASAADGESADDMTARYEARLRASLGEMLERDFVTDLVITEDAAAATSALSATLNFQDTVSADAVAERLGFIADLAVAPTADGGVSVSGTLAGTGFGDQEIVQRLANALQRADGLPAVNKPFLQSTTIGSRVGVELRDSAIQAIILAFVAIVLYIRVRFREFRYGIAAIVALFHDVAITLGLVALVHSIGFVDIEIDLAMIAAFLTIVGYSLNDTIVLFDRVRENLPRLDKPLDEVLDISVNQCLSRTLLTSITTMLVLVVIFYFSYGTQPVLEGFAFAMIVGVLVGTYSSIFVASPVVAWLARRADAQAAGAAH